MELYRFLSTSLPTINENTSIVSDNSHSHHGYTSSPLSSGKIRKMPCRWHSSLSVRESLEPRLDSPKRSIDVERAMPCVSDEEEKAIRDGTVAESHATPKDEANENEEVQSYTSCPRFDMNWAHHSFSPTRDAASEPPRMPYRHVGYFSGADDRIQCQ